MGTQGPHIIRESLSSPPMVDVPSQADIVLTGETQTLAENMTQTERDALLIMTFRNTQEIVGFVRDAQKAMDALQNANGPMASMMRAFMPTNGN